MRRSFHSHRARRGGNAVEFALLMPAFLFLTLGALEYGIFFAQQFIIDTGTRACARTAAYTAGDVPTRLAAARAAVTQELKPYKDAGILLFSDPDASLIRHDHANNEIVLECRCSATMAGLTGFVPHPGGIEASSFFRVEEARNIDD